MLADDRAFSDRYLPELRKRIGPYLLVPASLEQDRLEASDLVVLRARDLTIACRLRRPGYADRYPGQFTIRSRRESGAKTELAKIVEGFGDWFFYGHIGSDLQSIDPWWLIDLAAFRAHLIRDGLRAVKCLRHDECPNGDGTWFRWFAIDSFPADPPLLIAQSGIAPAPVAAAEIPWELTS